MFLVSAGVGGVGEDEEVVGILLEGSGVSSGDYWRWVVRIGGKGCAGRNVLPLK